MYKAVSYLRLSSCVRHWAFALMMIIILLSIMTGVSAQTSEWIVYDNVNSELPDTTVYDLALDAQGTLWIGTARGLARFDGATWTMYTRDNSGLPYNKVTALASDPQGTLWIGTGRGLARFDGTTWTVYTTDNSGLPYNAVHELAFDAQGTLWIGTGEFWGWGSGGLAKFDGETWTVYSTENSGLPGNHIIGLALDAQGNIWVGTVTGGAAQFDGETWTVYNQENSGLPAYDVSALAFDAEGTLWVATGRSAIDCGVAKFDGETWTVYNTKNSGLPSNNVHELTIDAQGNIWAGTEQGLAKFDGTTWTVYTTENSGLPWNWVWTIVNDVQGNTWIGTTVRGLVVYREGGVMLPAQKTDPESVLKALFAALNVKDVDGALALVTDDAVITVDQFVSRGKEEIRNWWEGVTAVNAFTQARNFQVDGDKATWTATVLIDPWRALELPPLDHNCEGIVQDGLVKSYSFIMTDNSMTKLQLAENKEITRRFMEDIWNKGDMTVADEIIAEDFVNHNPFGDLPPDREGLKIVAAGSAATPGEFTIDDIIVEGNKVAFRNRFHGDPEFEALIILYIKDGKITDRWGYHDYDQKFAEANKEIARRWVEEIWNKGDLSVIDEIVASDYVDRNPAPGQATDREAIKSGVTEFRTAFPDAHFTIDAMIAEGDKVVVPQTFTGTHQGELHGTPATGNQVTWTGIFICRFKDGKIVERWGALDTLGFMIQIGAVPPPGESGK